MTWLYVSFPEISLSNYDADTGRSKVFHKRKRKMFNLMTLIAAYSQIRFFFTVIPRILILSEFFIYQLMHKRIGLKIY